MAAYDNVPMPGAPGAPSYAPSPIDFSAISQIPGAFEQGQQYGVKRGLQTMYRDGNMPTKPDGSPDYGAIAQNALRIGGPEAAAPYFNMAIQQGNAGENQSLLSGQPQQPQQGNPLQTFTPLAPNAATGPGGITGEHPKSGPSGSILPGGEQIMGDDTPSGAGLQGRPAPFAGNRGDQQGAPPGPVAGGRTITEDGTTGQPTAPTSSRETTNNGPQDRRIVAADRLDAQAALLQAQAAKYGQNAAAVKSLHDRAQQLSDQAKQYREAALKDQELTPAAKDLNSGVTLRAEQQKNEVTQSQKTYNGIQASSTQYEKELKPYLDLSRSILSQPEMYSGIGGNLSLDFNKVRAAIGDQKAAVLQEALQKVTASSVLGQINQQRDQLMEAGGASSRIFSQQVELVEKAAPSISNTLYGNRFLVNVASRMGDFNTQVAQKARAYIAAHGHLDPKFDQQISDYAKAHPIFSPQELSDPRILGAPEAPPTIKSPQAAVGWAGKMGIKPGEPFRTPDGRIKYMPGAAPAAQPGAMHSDAGSTMQVAADDSLQRQKIDDLNNNLLDPFYANRPWLNTGTNKDVPADATRRYIEQRGLVSRG